MDAVKEDFPEVGVLLKVLSEAYLVEEPDHEELKLSSKWWWVWGRAIFGNRTVLEAFSSFSLCVFLALRDCKGYFTRILTSQFGGV